MNRNKNGNMMELIQNLKKASLDNEVKIWKRIASDLEKPTRTRRIVNIYKIEKYAKDNETIVVPGKVLGTGELSKKVNVAAFTFSNEAIKKISEKGDVLSLSDLMKKNPKGKGVRILG